ncbi:Serum paraoxonase/lactonase 3 [Colletotrichum chlorophyti]|uniref:Serum paraoxonase/lactonase 3 n=1 Tax=Colletotrichum chlorophyti TaxID=708187 RepID=A0A1Q8RA91_9PEZI|nr:Serum paraoxonase/lactonase 3 [Colletotrichum chlorophyti]
MAGFILQTSIIFAVLLAVALQLVLKDPIWLGFGIGKTFQQLSEFPYSCRRIEDPRLQACEDMWLSETTRQLFLACSDPLARQQWLPNAHHLNASGRSTRDAIIAMNIDSPKGDSYEFRTLATPGFSGTAGDGLLQLVGLTGIDAPAGDRVELLLVNNRPSVDAVTGDLLDQASVGHNATIEVFETGPQATEMKHIRTFADGHISTPNNVAALSSEAFYITNDNGRHKTGVMSLLGPLLGEGDVSFCSTSTGCKRVSERHRVPNGLVRSRDGLIYVPSAMAGGVQVYRIVAGDDGLAKVVDIPLPYAIDNLSVDADGDIYAAVFPRGVEILQAAKDPLNVRPKSAAVRIRKDGEGVYVWEKVIEDGEGELLPGSTVVVHDAKTGRLFFGGVTSPFIAVCEPRN